MRPKLAVFPKAYLDDLCVTGAMTLGRWIDMASTLGVEGLEFYSGMSDLQDRGRWTMWRDVAGSRGLQVPMLCCSPDFTHPDPAYRQAQVAKEQTWIDMTAALGGTHCRVLSGQRRPEITVEQGLAWAADGILACLPYAADRGVTLVLENHYKDQYWTYPEFAQRLEVFTALVDRIDPARWPNFGVNYDPSNAYLAGDDPLDLLARVKDRVVTMHASDRYLTSGTIDDLRSEEPSMGYATRLEHGEIGKGLNDYDAIFSVLSASGFTGWISLEDGVDGFDQLERSVAFLKGKIAEHWPAPRAPLRIS